MKLLDYTLITLLAGMASTASAQQAAPDAANDADDAPVAVECGADGCRTDEGLLFKLRTRGLAEPVTEGTGVRSSSEALAPDRRVSVGLVAPGKAQVSGKFSMALPNGGVIWATEDPTLGQPELSISAPSMVPFDGERITRPVAFYVRSNYPAFIDRYELTIYRAADGDLIDPLTQVAIDVAAVSNADWDGALPSKFRFRKGDELVYVLRAYDKDGRFDETQPRTLQLVSEEEASRGASQIRDSLEKSLGTALSVEQAQTQSLVDRVFAGDGLRQQNIPIRGSRIRLQGRNLPQDHALKINGERYPVDLERKFVAEFLAPVGQHPFEIALDGGAQPLRHTLDVDVSGKYLFAVALADVTIAQNNVRGSTTPFDNDRRYDDDILADGRLAFYAKGKFDGKYLVTAQADTTQRDVKQLFTGFTSADPQDIFRRLDPDMVYPTYGDDSTTYRDVDTMGRFYLRADWDKNQALWGNYSTGFTGTQYGQYVRSLYGAALDWRSLANNVWGDPTTQVRVFGSEAQTAPGHSEFIGTGGSLYYLRHTDVLPGSDIVVLEVRDRTTGRVESRIDLLRGADYEIDELQGRLLLTRPLAQLTRENIPTLTRDYPLDGFEQRLLVDYEWVPTSFDADQVAAGFRGKHWFGDHVGVGLTYVDESRAGDDYTLAGADLTLQAGKGTYLKLEHTRTESTSAPVFFSDNGGFTFTQLNPVGPRTGEASAVDARANFKELGVTDRDWSAGAWWRRVDAGYSVSRFDIGADIKEVGAELAGELSGSLGIYARASRAERGAESLTQAQLTAEWRIDEDRTLSGEVRRVDEKRGSGDANGTLGALKYAQRFGTSLELYGTAQLTLDDDSGRYADNDALTLGGKYLFGDLSTVGAELTTGDRGDSAQVDAEYRIDTDHSLYGAYTYSTDRTEYDPLFNTNRQNGWTLGQRWRLSNQVNLFNESQFLKTPSASGLAHTFGMDLYPAQGWNTGFTLQQGDLTNADGGNVDRRAVSINGGRTSPGTDWQSKLEWRRDTGAEQREQWVTTNRLMHKLNESLSLAARANYSETTDKLDSAAGARFAEANLGFAYRPWNSTRWGLFGRYTYLYDLSTLGQVGGADYDQRSQILSLEGVYKQDQHWEYAAKLARRAGEVRYGRGTGAWADSATTFAAGQVRYELIQKWHALAEYRWLDVDNGGTRQGWLAGVDRDINRNFRLGVGYNFTDFSDDLTNFDYDHKGWFINLVGSY
ncbi:TonB-dependent receptor [Novilysobacter avium]|uniref:TonB-dependent receptor n=1 Tax=Novilysobacter avium TaxID=2781023 RepID=A0A7S6ZU62_9GAMM|nr:TonB-dependent receptor [Lysobacter avium]QOW21708.1 TonB-dependent receptor [Lysobacter avium]